MSLSLLVMGRGSGSFICHPWVQGAEEDAEKLQLTDKLLQAVLAEAGVVYTGQPVLIAGDFNADPAVIPCLVKAISGGRFVDLALAYSLGEGKRPAATWKFKLGERSGTRGDLILGCPNAIAVSTACMVTDRWFLLIFLCLPPLVLMVGLLRFPAPLFPSLCGPPAGPTLLVGSRAVQDAWDVLEMNLVLYLLTLCLLCGMRFPGLRLMDDFWSIWSRSAEAGFVRAYCRAGGPIAAGSPKRPAACSWWVFWRAELLVAGDRVGCIGLVRRMRLMCTVLSTLLNLLSLRMCSRVSAIRVLLSLGGMLFWGYWGAVCRHGPCGPISSLDPWDMWIPPDLQRFLQVGFDSLEVLNGFIKQVVDNRRNVVVRKWTRWLREDLGSGPYAWLRPDLCSSSFFGS